MRNELIKIAIIFLGIFVMAPSAFSDEYKLTNIGRNIIIEKGVISHLNIKNLPDDVIMRMNNLKNPQNLKNMAEFGFPEELFKRWPIAIISIPTVFTSNFKFINKGK